jgi:hypothetical protein
LPALDEAVLVADDIANLDDVARDAVLEYANSLRHAQLPSVQVGGSPHLGQGHTPGEQLDHVSRLKDDVRVKGFARSFDEHRALHEVECAAEALRGVS